MNSRFVIGLEGLTLSAQERDRLQAFPPRGVILFARNIESPEQVKALLESVREVAGEGIWAAIDEEGGRVCRMPWAPFSPRRHAADFGARYASDPDGAVRAVYEDSFTVGRALKALGFTHNCAPVLDLLHPEGHAIIGQRAYGSDVAQVIALADSCRKGLEDAGIAAVGKHFPGHGRANADSHVAVPEVDADLSELLGEAEPFCALVRRGMKHIMTAHVIYRRQAGEVATLSPFWIKQILREKMGFSGCVWSDDLSMKGVGDDPLHAADLALDSGCDVLLLCEPEGVKALYQVLFCG